MPELVRDSLLVVQPFKHKGLDYVTGDRIPLRHRSLRRLAVERPEWFRMEYETAEVDLAWLTRLEADFEARYQEVKRDRDEAKKRQERALREELKAQDRPQPDLERRYAKQEDEDRRRKEGVREERERERLEEQAALVGQFRDGFHDF